MSIKAKTSTFVDGIKYKVPSTKQNSIDFHYEESKCIYHGTYFNSKELYCEEIVYVDNSSIWYMKYKGGVLDNETIDLYTKVLKPALKNINCNFSLRRPKKYNYQKNNNEEYTNLAMIIKSTAGNGKVSEKNKNILNLFSSGQIDYETAVFAIKRTFINE